MEPQAPLPADERRADESRFPPPRPADTPVRTDRSPKLPINPLAQAMAALSKPKLDIRQVHGDGDPTGKNLI
jgi:hypothetical protein